MKYFDYTCTDQPGNQRSWSADYSCCVQTPTVCTIGGTTYTAGQANPANPCQSCQPSVSASAFTDIADGTACDDGNACTDNDVCTGGACAGTSYACAAPDQCQQPGTCNGDGTCSFANVTDGTACNDGNACTADDTCQAGACAGTNPVCAAPRPVPAARAPATRRRALLQPDAAERHGLQRRQRLHADNDVCTGGRLHRHGPFTCTAPDQCHAGRDVQPATGPCSNAERAERHGLQRRQRVHADRHLPERRLHRA